MAQRIAFIDVIVIILFLVCLIYLRVVKVIRTPGQADAQARKPGQHIPFASWLKDLFSSKIQMNEWVTIRPRLAILAELAAIVLWALWVGRNYLVLDSKQWFRYDWMLNVQSYFNWGLLGKCGGCVFWNGSFNGGAPLFIDLIASLAHPVVILLVLLAGAINGLKLVAVAGLIMAGLAQWWWAKEMRLGLVPRLWSAVLAVIGGYMIGRMQAGLSEMVFSIASVMLVIPPALRLARTGERRMAIITGILLGLAILSGQGYMQLALVLAVAPAFLILLIDRRFRFRPVWKEFVLAGFIAALITAFLLVPVLHDATKIIKDGTTANYIGTQPLEYQPLNLVIRDNTYYGTDVLQKIPWPSQTVTYIGWIPILFVFLAFRLVPPSGLRQLIFYLTAVFLIYLLSSALIFKLFFLLAPDPLKPLTILARFPSLIASLAAPFLLAIAAWGLDLLLQEKWWPTLTLRLTSETVIVLSLAWLLVIPLVFSVKFVHDFVKPWMETNSVSTEVDDYEKIVLKLKPSTVQWFEPPLGDMGFNIVALENGIKLTNVLHNWGLKDRTAPLPYIKVTRDAVDSSDPNYVGVVDFVSVFSYPENLYASVDAGTDQIPCQATALGGNIDIQCETKVAGQLTVYENSWSGWSVKRDGKPVRLGPGQWLTTQAPAGKHLYQFRYRPWDVPLGVALSLIGLGLSIWLWFRKPTHRVERTEARIVIAG